MGHSGSDRVCQPPTRRRTLATSPARYHAEYDGNDFAGCPEEAVIPTALFWGITPISSRAVPMLMVRRARGNWFVPAQSKGCRPNPVFDAVRQIPFADA
jgi:hypothetical protein